MITNECDQQNLPGPDSSGHVERWITAPTTGSCPFTGLKHAKFYQEFSGKPSIRQVRTGSGKCRGKRLFWLPDIFSELHRQAHEQMSKDEKQSEEE